MSQVCAFKPNMIMDFDLGLRPSGVVNEDDMAIYVDAQNIILATIAKIEELGMCRQILGAVVQELEQARQILEQRIASLCEARYSSSLLTWWRVSRYYIVRNAIPSSLRSVMSGHPDNFPKGYASLTDGPTERESPNDSNTIFEKIGAVSSPYRVTPFAVKEEKSNQWPTVVIPIEGQEGAVSRARSRATFGLHHDNIISDSSCSDLMVIGCVKPDIKRKPLINVAESDYSRIIYTAIEIWYNRKSALVSQSLEQFMAFLHVLNSIRRKQERDSVLSFLFFRFIEKKNIFSPSIQDIRQASQILEQKIGLESIQRKDIDMLKAPDLKISSVLEKTVACVEENQKKVGAFESEILSLTLRKKDYDRLRWLAKNLGFPRREFSSYITNAIYVYLRLYTLQDSGKYLYYGTSPLRAVRFTLSADREMPTDWDTSPDDVHLTIELRSEQAELLRQTCGIGLVKRFIWNSLWAYNDLLSDYMAGQRIYVGNGNGNAPEEELNIKPAVLPRQYREVRRTEV